MPVFSETPSWVLSSPSTAGSVLRRVCARYKAWARLTVANSFILPSLCSRACRSDTTSATSWCYPAVFSPLYGSGKWIWVAPTMAEMLIPGSVQTTTGGQCMTVLLTAIWPSFKNIPNHIPADEGITSAGMVGFLLYFLLQLPFLCIPYTKVLSPY